MRNIILGVTGSVAAIKTGELALALSKVGDVRIVATSAAMYFLEQSNNIKIHDGWEPKKNLEFNGVRFPLFQDSDEWPNAYSLGDPVLHIELRNWASCLVVAPLSANTLAKFHHGLCDNLLSCLYRAWNWQRHVIVAPAMNTMMWENDPTKPQIRSLLERGVSVVDPVEKRLACGDVGVGAMASVEPIAEAACFVLRWQFPLKQCSGVPINHHPGAFGFHRRKNHHTGVDLYCQDGQEVFAVEDGIVVNIEEFTGPTAGHNWWEETWGIMIEGASGVVNYGEVASPQLSVGDVVRRGNPIARVKRVLFEGKHRPDIPGHSTSMLHVELYKHGVNNFANWHEPQKNPNLLDPTPYLMNAVDAPTETLTWDNEAGQPVG